MGTDIFGANDDCDCEACEGRRHTTPEMNAEIVGILRTNDSPHCLYAALRIEELEAIVDKLPVTADGVPVVPGTVLYVLHSTGADFIEQCEVAGVFRYKVLWTKPDHHGYDGAKLTCCYSTQAAAQAAGEE